MIPFTCDHCEASMLMLVPLTSNRATLDGLELVANARLNPVQVPEVDQMNVCGKPTEAPAEGLLNVAMQAALAAPTVPLATAPAITNNRKQRRITPSGLKFVAV